MKNTLISICIFILICSFSNCRIPAETVFRIKVENNTAANICYIVSLNYPDTSIPADKTQLHGLGAHVYGSYDSNEDWSKVLGNSKGGKISFFFFNNDTLGAYDWSIIMNGYKIMKRQDFSIEDLNANDFTAAYP